MSLWSRLSDTSQWTLRPTGPGKVLDVGCGSAKYPGAVGLDISADTDADVVHDLNIFPYPFEENSFDQILLQDVIEHVENPIAVFEELNRIARPNARIQLRTPHFSSVLAYGDPTHRQYLSTIALRQLAQPLYGHYSKSRMRVVHITLDFWPPFRLCGIGWLANRTDFLQLNYEIYFAFTFTCMNMRAEYEVIKS